MANTVLVISNVIGWIYTLVWASSMYPQPIENYSRGNVAGFSLEYALLNVTGYFFYFIYSMSGFIDPNIGTGTVLPNDLAFVVHAFLVSSNTFT